MSLDRGSPLGVLCGDLNDKPNKKRHEKEHASNTSIATTSAKSFNLSCKGVFSESRRNATSHCLVREHKHRRDKGRTHHDTSVETFWPNSDDQLPPPPRHCCLHHAATAAACTAPRRWSWSVIGDRRSWSLSLSSPLFCRSSSSLVVVVVSSS